jgi:hypothetical protein
LSSTATVAPAAASARASVEPAGPPPTFTASRRSSALPGRGAARRRQVVVAIAREQYLEKLHAAGGERSDRTGEVQLPGAREFGAARRAHLVDRAEVTHHPVAQRLGVMQPQVLDVEHAETAGLENRHHFAERGRLRAREDAPLDPAVHGFRAIAPDRMDQAEAVRREAAVDHPPSAR